MKAISYYYDLLDKDTKALREEMLKGVNQLLEQYTWVLNLVVELSHLAAAKKPKKGTPPYTNFINNKVIVQLKSNKELENASIKSSYTWQVFEEDLKSWLKNIIKPSERFNEYLKKASPNFEDDKNIIQYLIKSICLKTKPSAIFLNWLTW